MIFHSFALPLHYKKKYMGKGKLAKFAEMKTMSNVFEYPFSVIDNVPFDMKGHWREQYFHNDNPIVLELGCGKGAKLALEEGMTNVAFLRTSIEIIDRFFAEDEVQEIWLTFSDPQMKNPRKRLTSTYFMERYRRFLVDGGLVHLKTDSNFLFTYTRLMVEKNQLPVDMCTEDLYHATPAALVGTPLLTIQTYYEKMWMERGLNIRYLRFHLPKQGTLVEPEVEIPLDEYRSYHRSKRSSKETAR